MLFASALSNAFTGTKTVQEVLALYTAQLAAKLHHSATHWLRNEVGS